MKIKFVIPILLFGTICFSSCVKEYLGTETQGISSGQPNIALAEGGMATFSKSALTFPVTDLSDTAFFHVEYAGNTVASKDVVVKFGYDATALTTYNSTQSASGQYTKFPDSIYSLASTSATIKAGQNYSSAIPLVVYPSKVDASKNYMLPITITDGGGNQISGNIKTIYYHLIGNPLAGTYTWDFTRYSAPSNAGSPDANSFTGHSTVLVGTSPTSLEVASGYYIGPRYEVTFTNTAGVLSDFKVILNADDITTMAGAGVKVTDGPNILVADPVNKVFTFQYKTLTRYVIDSYHK